MSQQLTWAPFAFYSLFLRRNTSASFFSRCSEAGMRTNFLKLLQTMSDCYFISRCIFFLLNFKQFLSLFLINCMLHKIYNWICCTCNQKVVCISALKKKKSFESRQVVRQSNCIFFTFFPLAHEQQWFKMETKRFSSKKCQSEKVSHFFHEMKLKCGRIDVIVILVYEIGILHRMRTAFYNIKVNRIAHTTIQWNCSVAINIILACDTISRPR